MDIWPETRDSLIQRLKNPQDAVAWNEFLAIYRPVVIRMARRRGLQHADAEDLAQRVFLSVSKKVSEWEPQSEETRFRNWLGRVSRNAILNALTRVKPDQAPGDGGHDGLLDQLTERNDLSAVLIRETRRQAVLVAAQALELEFHPDTWSLFHQTAVEGRSVKEVAEATGRSTGAVYVARCRIMQRIRDHVQNLSGFWSDES
ncbi:MAG: sigma-70 family RNA polymerase sigma factor [Planctomycetaceae bacterium]|nr:sigma-70 family RNA polymerase sigma factor [Planctomycetaceae bacterium]